MASTSDKRFEFCANWSHSFFNLDEKSSREAKVSLCSMLRSEAIKGKFFFVLDLVWCCPVWQLAI